MNNQQALTLRIPSEADAQAIITYAKFMFASTDQVITTPGEYTMTPEQEAVWIQSMNQDPNSYILIAEMDHMVVGLLDFSPKTKIKTQHTGEFGISIHPNYRSKGIGRQMVQQLLEWAKGSENIEKVILQVFASNPHAIRLYTSLGFKEEGRFPKAIKQPNGAYVDLIQMGLFVKTVNIDYVFS
jgi:RimJ/RimL family protein N-acetyltransferase